MSVDALIQDALSGRAQSTKWHFNEYGLLTNKLDQAGAEILRYQYDADLRLTNRWSAAKGNTSYSYDGVGNLLTITYPVSHGVTFQYDRLNRLTNMVDAVGTTVYSYTAGNQLLTEDGPFSNDTVTNTYVNRLRTALALQQPTGLWTNGFRYDAARRLTNVTSQAGSFTNEYFPGVAGASGYSSSLIKRLLLPNLSIITNNYDSVGRRLGTWLNTSTGTVLDYYVYAYDPANHRTNVTRTDSSTVAFQYDNIGQLTVADSSVNTEDRGYNYDAAWNLHYRTNNGAASGFSVDGKNEMTFFAGYSYGYDDNGNLISGPPGGYRAYTYDDENRLTSVQLLNTWRSEFWYDGLGRMRTHYEYTWALGQFGYVWQLTSTTRYIYDGMRVIQERSGPFSPTVSYTRGNDLSGSLEGAGGIGGLLARSSGYSSGTGNWTNHNFYHADGNGNITYLVNSSQALAASYRYDPFGNTISSSGTLASANVYGFSSKEVHPNTGMYYFGYRFYDPNLQRWINRDPFDDPGFQRVRGSNGNRARRRWKEELYVFVENSPISNSDPLGLLHFDGTCSQEQEQMISASFARGCKKAKDNDCFKKCKGHEADGDKLCGNGADGKTFSCGSVGDSNCGTWPGGNCGNTPSPFTTMYICPQALRGQCGDVSCTVIHELTHSIGGKDYRHPNNTANDVEKCIGCP